MAAEYKRARFRASLNRVVSMMGGERTPVLIALLIAAYFGFIFSMSGHILKGILIGMGVWTFLVGILRRMGKADMQLMSVFWRHLKYKAFFPAHGRFGAWVPDFKPFIKRR